MSYRVVVRDASRNRVGILPHLTLSATLKARDVGTWSLTADSRYESMIEPGFGILVLPETEPLEGDAIFSGPVAALSPASDEVGKNTLTLTGFDDNIHLQDRFVYPKPTATFEQQTITVDPTAEPTDVRSGFGETVMKQLVNLNAGPGALVARRVAGLTIQTDAALGTSVEITSRFERLLTQVGKAALSSGLTFRVVQVGTDLQFQVWQPVDRSATARFSRPLGNLGGWAYTLAAPTATATGVAGSGVLEDRAFIERVDTTSQTEWGRRVEDFLDQRSTDVATELEQAGDANNVEKGPQGTLTMNPRDIPALRFARDYQLDDIVTVEISGQPVVDAVRQVTLTDGAGGSTVAPLIGPDGATADNALTRRVRDLSKRLDALERRS